MNAGNQFTRLEGLGQIIIRPQLQSPNFVLRVGTGRQHQDRNIIFLPDRLAHLPAIHIWHHHIQQHNIELLTRRQVQRFPPCRGLRDLKSLFRQINAQQIAHIPFIIHDQRLELCHL
ncbi:hypothetical protein D3C71_1751620 [compost metagenome]